MALLTVASKADGVLILPAMLAAAHVSQSNPHHGIVIEYKDVVSLGKRNEKVILTTNNDHVIVDGSVMPYLVGQKGTEKSDVCWSKNGCIDLAVPDFKSLHRTMKELEFHLSLRSYIVGYSLTLADLAVWGVLRGNMVTTSLRRNCVNISRWFEFIEISNPWITAVVADLSNVVRQRKAA